MKNRIIIFVAGLLIQQVIHAQGTTYLSNLGLASSGSVSVGSDSWYAALFVTGTNSSGYALDSVQLAMADATGNPGGFTVMVYTDVGTVGALPGSSLGTLNGSLNPVNAGTYTYSAPSNLTLSPNTSYFIVLASGTTLVNGANNWNVTSSPTFGYNSYHWGYGNFLDHSSNGINWNLVSGTYGQFAITATPVPEPSSEILLGLGGLSLLWYRRIARAV